MRRRKKNKDVLIDLTSLLDVIFIVLLVVVCQLQNIEQKTSQAEQDATKAQQDARMEKELYDDQIDSIKNLSDYLVLISVNSHFESDLKTRHIDLLCSDKTVETPQISDLQGMSVEKGYGELREFIQKYISENTSKTIILSLNENDEDILYRDEKAIKKIFNDFSSAYDNVKQKD